MFFSWWRRRKRRKILESPFPGEWLAILENQVAHWELLSEPERARLQDSMRIFCAEKTWEGCGGLEMTIQIQATISALASLMVLGLEDFYFERVQTILVYPQGYTAPDHEVLGDNMVLEGEMERLGEAHYRGPVILAWDEIEEDARELGTGRNLVFHEFAHQLDMLDGVIDGNPPWTSRTFQERWQRVMDAEYDRLLRDADRGRPTVLDPYGASEPAEFFAVATECFFDNPLDLQERHPQLYDLLKTFYQQDPARWFLNLP